MAATGGLVLSKLIWFLFDKSLLSKKVFWNWEILSLLLHAGEIVRKREGHLGSSAKCRN